MIYSLSHTHAHTVESGMWRMWEASLLSPKLASCRWIFPAEHIHVARVIKWTRWHRDGEAMEAPDGVR